MTARILVGDALTMLRTLESESVQVCVTSPPYFGLRDYGTAAWEGGDPSHGHYGRSARTAPAGSAKQASNAGANAVLAGDCPCGAVRTDGQIGLEPTPAEFIANLVAVFDEVKRVLRPDGLCFVNLGDSYSGSGKGPTGGNGIGDQEQRQGFRAGSARADGVVDGRSIRNRNGIGPVASIPAKNLLLIPERFAIAMQDAGWVVRSRIAWCKKSAMPESVRDRPTSAWEHIWMFAKQARYFYDADAVRQSTSYPLGYAQPSRPAQARDGVTRSDGLWRNDIGNVIAGNPAGANLRNVWSLGPSPFADAHFATFPPEIPRRCILAGTSEKGACPACGAPWRRVVERSEPSYWEQRKGHDFAGRKVDGEPSRTGNYKSVSHGRPENSGVGYSANITTGWQPSCPCPPADPVPCVVLDPFLGSGTTALVADQLGRDAVGIELSPKYAAMAEQRIAGDCPMFTDVAVIHGTTRDMMGQHDDAAS